MSKTAAPAAADISFDADSSLTDLPYSVSLDLTVNEPALIAELVRFEEGRLREEYALCALRIGLLALKQARGQVDADVVRREGDRFLGELQTRLTLHSKEVFGQLTASLKEYFDPTSGRFEDRVQRLIKKDGELEQVLRRQIGSRDSELCQTLTQHVGQQSPLMKLLSPNESEGLLKALRDAIGESLTTQRQQILGEFSLDNKEGALTRLVGELQGGQGKLTEQLQTKIDEVVTEFSLDKKDSALSRLVRRVTRAQRTISDEFSLDNENSALSRMSKVMQTTSRAIDDNLTLDKEHSALSRLKRELIELLKSHGESNQKFQEEVKVALTAMAATRAEAERSTRHGRDFEQMACDFLEKEAQKAGDVARATGATTGLIKNCKVGDVVVELGPEAAAAGGTIAVEAKERAEYDLAKARAELETARKNRGAHVGLFVFSRRTAPAGLQPVIRLGQDVFVVWDADDLQSDLFLRVGFSLARFLCHSQAKERQTRTADFEAIDRAILEIEKRAKSLDEMRTWTQTIQSNSDKLVERIDIMKKALEKQVQVLRDTTEDLKQMTGSPDRPSPTDELF